MQRRSFLKALGLAFAPVSKLFRKQPTKALPEGDECTIDRTGKVFHLSIPFPDGHLEIDGIIEGWTWEVQREAVPCSGPDDDIWAYYRPGDERINADMSFILDNVKFIVD